MSEKGYTVIVFVQLIAVFIGTLVTLVLLPLIPAWITYKITPDQKLGAGGPLGGLSVRATGAFAAYLIVLLVCMYASQPVLSMIGATVNPAWTVKGRLVVHDADGRDVTNQPGARPRVTFEPDLFTVTNNEFILKLPMDIHDWPLISFTIPEFGGSAPLRLQDWDPNLDRNDFKKIVSLEKPIVIRQLPKVGLIPSGNK